MKELTIEEKAKRYEEALEKMKSMLTSWETLSYNGKTFLQDLESIFHELKESEGEKTRKDIKRAISVALDYSYFDKETANKCIAWLEKQGEQKPIVEMKSAEESLGISSEEYNDIVNECLHGESESSDKVELKFKVGDWITNGDYTWKIIEVKPLDYILQSQDGNIVDDTISHVDEQFHSFSIEDAKDGDVLASELCDSIILFRGIKDDNIDFYCDYDFSKIDIPGDRFTVNNGQHYGNVEDSKDFYPATKEQRDTLFSKMHEAGYEWNAEKKELKKIEQKPQRMVSAEAKEALYDKPTDEEMKELLRTEYEKGRADTIAEMYVPTQISPEESLGVSSEKYMDIVDTLTQGGQKPAKWSLEDERVIAIINNALTESNTPPDDYDKVYDWLESIKQRIGG